MLPSLFEYIYCTSQYDAVKGIIIYMAEKQKIEL